MSISLFLIWAASQMIGGRKVAFIDHLARHPNIYTDSAGVRRFDLLEQAVERAGARKILFGSDGPWLHPGVELAKIAALTLSRDDEALVLGGNFLRLITKAGRRDHAKKEYRLAYSAPTRRSSIGAANRAIPGSRTKFPNK